MDNDLTLLEGCLKHRHGRQQPGEEESSSTTPPVVQPSQTDQKVCSTVWNILAKTSQSTVPSRGGQFKSQANRGCAWGNRAREESRDAVPKGEDVSRPITRFEVDRNPTKMKEGEVELIKDMYQVLD